MELDQLLDLLRSECTKAGSQAAWAVKNKLSPPYVSDVLNRRREPGASILKALGVAKVVAYRRIPASVSSVDASQGGKTDLPMSAVMEYCENPMALTPDEVVLEAIRG